MEEENSTQEIDLQIDRETYEAKEKQKEFDLSHQAILPPTEEEIGKKKAELKKFLTQYTNEGKQKKYKVQFFDLKTKKKHEIPAGKSIFLGRRKEFKLTDPRLSRNQLEVQRNKDTDDFCNIIRRGRNPSVIKRLLDPKKRTIMKKDIVYSVYKGDEISLLVTLYNYKVQVKEVQDPHLDSNYLFYKGLIQSQPNGDFIDNIHSKWFGKYDHLEREHGYIQWLFPVFESKGMNYLSKKLRREVAELMRKDEEIAHRFIKSYQLMLDFYGMELADLKTGEIRASSNWKTRYQNLDSSYHNNLRISRILMSLGELGFRRWKKPLVDFLSSEIQSGKLKTCAHPFHSYWLPLLDEDSKAYMEKTKETLQDREDSIYFKN